MNGQIIKSKYLDKMKTFFENHSLSEFQIIYDNEDKFKKHFGVKTFKFCNSGTSALYLIMKYLDDIFLYSPKVWGPAFGHISFVNVCEWLDLKYKFIDVKEDTLSLDPQKLLKEISEHGAPDVLVMVDMGGYIGEDTLMVRKICDEHDIIMVEDSAYAIGQEYNNIKAGTVGDFSFFSFANPKLLSIGEGGCIMCNIEDLDDVFEEYIYQGGFYKYNKESRFKGLNFILSNWSTELLSMQLDDIEEIQREHAIKFKQKNNGQFFAFESSLLDELYAPSFFVWREKNPNLKIIDKIPNIMHKRYTNLGDEKFEVSETLERELIYYLI